MRWLRSQNAAIADLATKFDLKELDLKIERDFTEVKAEQRLMKWMLGFCSRRYCCPCLEILLCVIVATLVKFL